jgi:hypothetical protein
MGVRTVTRPDARDEVRNEPLKSSLYDDVPLAQVESVITGGDLAEGVPEVQQLALLVIRSLVEDGLMKFEGWMKLVSTRPWSVCAVCSLTSTTIPVRGYSLSGSRRLNPVDALRKR